MPGSDSGGRPTYEFGWWPEFAGSLYAVGLIAFLIYFADGFL